MIRPTVANSIRNATSWIYTTVIIMFKELLQELSDYQMERWFGLLLKADVYFVIFLATIAPSIKKYDVPTAGETTGEELPVGGSFAGAPSEKGTTIEYRMEEGGSHHANAGFRETLPGFLARGGRILQVGNSFES